MMVMGQYRAEIDWKLVKVNIEEGFGWSDGGALASVLWWRWIGEGLGEVLMWIGG